MAANFKTLTNSMANSMANVYAGSGAMSMSSSFVTNPFGTNAQTISFGGVQSLPQAETPEAFSLRAMPSEAVQKLVEQLENTGQLMAFLIINASRRYRKEFHGDLTQWNKKVADLKQSLMPILEEVQKLQEEMTGTAGVKEKMEPRKGDFEDMQKASNAKQQLTAIQLAPKGHISAPQQITFTNIPSGTSTNAGFSGLMHGGTAVTPSVYAPPPTGWSLEKAMKKAYSSLRGRRKQK